MKKNRVNVTTKAMLASMVDVVSRETGLDMFVTKQEDTDFELKAENRIVTTGSRKYLYNFLKDLRVIYPLIEKGNVNK
uniref:Uncharacterized protein n=1 Tax=Podoviridae sp. ctza028 TaxID=2825289 RepID=A0A8S5Q3T3_9CAUD|nr:MAG TPA: hypothetical protein [Podoviridae sp. ctza028]